VVERERFTEFNKTLFLGRVLGIIFGADPKLLARAEALLELSVFQTAFDPKAIQYEIESAEAVMAEEYAGRRRDADLLARVDSYTEEDEETPADAFKVDLQRTKLSGIDDPWGSR